ncbi:MAG TPA: methyltransferase domain-containing protein [Verrucomicrobiae bacterium]|nr:methyltransferase domain-containing protein [Verrucomicrobiae bacterium]
MLAHYFTGLYRHTMERAYAHAHTAIVGSGDGEARVLECGAGIGATFDLLASQMRLRTDQYRGIEWHEGAAAHARQRGLHVETLDLNQGLSADHADYSCIYALSVLEHLLNPCALLRDCHRALRPGGTLVLLTPNISTYFTAALILLGRMPSTGPHPDSNALLEREEIFKVNAAASGHRDAEAERPVHRHLIVFSYRVLRDYLRMAGFRDVQGRGFGLYPFPRALQPLLERLDPWHCHQMVFVARK